MKFLDRTNKFFGLISVKERGNQVHISGIDGIIMRKYFKTLFETDTISKMMFTSVSDTSIVLHKFFIPDFLYMLTVFRHDPKCNWSTKRTIDRVVSGILRNTWYKVTTKPVVSMIDESRKRFLKWDAMPKQLEALHLFGDKMPRYDLRGYILALAPGLGKTFTDLLIATCIIPVEIAEVKIIISPKKAVNLVWEKSIKAVFKTVPTHWVVGSGIKMPWDKTEYYVFNFEQLEQAIALGKHLISKGKRYFVIVDESHNFADHRSERTQKLVKLQTLNDKIYFLWASGSPILKSAVELVSFLKCSDPRFDAEAERRFKRIYSAAPGRANQIFNHRLGNMMAFVVGKSEVSSTKPTVKELPVKLPPSLSNKFLMSTVKQEMRDFVEQRLVFYAKNIKDYRDIVEHWLHYHKATLNSRAAEVEFNTYQKNLKMLMRAPDLMLTDVMADARNYERTKLLPSLPPLEKKAFRNALSAVKNIKLKVRGEALGTVLSKRRSECAAALALYCKPDVIMKESLSKTLFFASSVLPVKVLEKHLKGLGFEPLLVYAETNNNLAANIEAFTDDPNINPICATMQSLSEAVPVIAASTVVLLNRPFRQATYDQVVARADRLGQIHPVTVIEVTLDTGGEPNVSSSTDAILASVRELINEIVGESFAGPNPDDREYEKVIDASKEDPNLFKYETELGL